MVVTCFSSYYEKILATGEVKCIDDELPYSLPCGWEWCRMGSIGEWGAGATPAKSNIEYYNGNILWLRTGELNNDVVYDTEIKITERAFKECSLRLNKVGDVMIAMYGATIGKVAIVGKEMTTNQACCACTPIGIFNWYLFYFLMGSQLDFIKKGEGGAQPNISREKLIAHLMPVPPIEEQHRIVSQIRIILPYVERYAHSQVEQNLLNEGIKSKLRKSILQEAIKGNLVPQDPNEESASILLQRIKEEKLRLVKEGKLKKKDVVDSVIFKGDDNKYFEKKGKEVICIDEEIPFNIPQSWEWCRLGTITSIFGGKRIPVGCKLSTIDTGHKYIRVSDMKNGTIALSDIHYITEEVYQQIKAYSISKDDLYITVAGTIGRIGEVPKELDNANLTENADKIVFSQINKRFLMFALQSEYVQSQIKSHTTKVGQPKLAIMRIQELLIALPPLQEQIRIVKRFEDVSVHLT